MDNLKTLTSLSSSQANPLRNTQSLWHHIFAFFSRKEKLPSRTPKGWALMKPCGGTSIGSPCLVHAPPHPGPWPWHSPEDRGGSLVTRRGVRSSPSAIIRCTLLRDGPS